MSSISRSELTWVGLDVHKDSIQAGIIRPGSDAVELQAIFNDEALVRKAFERGLGPHRQLRVCYEAGPTGYGLARQLQQMRIACQVIAPSLIPKAPGDKVKTDRRDARRLARLYRPASSSRSASRPPPRRRCATSAGRGPTWSRISPAPATASASSSCDTR